MAKEKDIKSINRKYLIGYMFLNYFLFGWFSNLFVFSLNDLEKLFQKVVSPVYFIGLLIIPLCLILEAVISSDLKYKLVFCRFSHPLPGSRAFSLIASKDHRIDMREVARLFESGIPQDPGKQNSAWYAFYKKHSCKVIVSQTHKAFLLTRDLATLTMVFAPASLVAHLIWGTPASNIWKHMVILSAILIATIIACQNYGKRFVANVIVEELHS